jgi:hypothetical protein
MDTWLFRPPVLVGERIVWLGSGSGLPQCGVVRWIGVLPEMGSDWTVGIELVGIKTHVFHGIIVAAVARLCTHTHTHTCAHKRVSHGCLPKFGHLCIRLFWVKNISSWVEILAIMQVI